MQQWNFPVKRHSNKYSTAIFLLSTHFQREREREDEEVMGIDTGWSAFYGWMAGWSFKLLSAFQGACQRWFPGAFPERLPHSATIGTSGNSRIHTPPLPRSRRTEICKSIIQYQFNSISLQIPIPLRAEIERGVWINRSIVFDRATDVSCVFQVIDWSIRFGFLPLPHPKHWRRRSERLQPPTRLMQSDRTGST